jgi:hypothetical protein
MRANGKESDSMKETQSLVKNGAILKLPAPRPRSEAQKEASRRNAKRSTGPRSMRGKAASSANAVKHGVCARPLFPYGLFARENLLRNALAGESKAEFEKLLDALDEAFNPADVFERLLVEKMALLLWRTRRLHRYERSKVDGQINVQKIIAGGNGIKSGKELEERMARHTLPEEDALRTILRYEAMLSREFMRCYALLERRKQQAERGEDAPPMQAVLCIK